MVAVWRRAWKSKVPSSTGHRGGGDSLRPICSASTTSGTTPSTTTSSDPVAERALPPALVAKENSEESGRRGRATEADEESARTCEHIRGLVEEFRGAADGSAATAPDRWLSELRVGWLLRPAGELSLDAAWPAGQLQNLAQSWVQALHAITASIWGCFVSGWCSQSQEEAAASDQSLRRFVEATLLKMLTFVDAVAGAPLGTAAVDDDPGGQRRRHLACTSARAAGEKLQALLDVRDALSTASEHILLSLGSSSSQPTRITDDMRGLLSAEAGKLDAAVWDTVDQIRAAAAMACLTDDDDVSDHNQANQTSPGVHRVTRSVTGYISVLSSNLWSVYGVAPQRHGDLCPSSTLIARMAGSLEEKLAGLSRSFPDRSLRLLFLINNSYFVWEQLHASCLTVHGLTSRVDGYIQSYLQVSWAPLLKCLRSPAALRCFAGHSALPEFEAKFLRTYNAQKLWKVPDPELRRRLREAVTQEVTSGLTKYLEDNNTITPGITPHALGKMLQELFEG